MGRDVWPKSADALHELGYRADRPGECRSCKATVLWTRTPAGKWMPLVEVDSPNGDADETRYFAPHFGDCPEAKEWSKGAA